MRKVYRVEVIKKITVEAVEVLELHPSWAKAFNTDELYAVKIDNEYTQIFLASEKTKKCSPTSIVHNTSRIKVPITFAREHFKCIAEANNRIGMELRDSVNRKN